MAKQKLFGNRSEPRCETCAHGKASADSETVLCAREGAVPSYHHCRRFVYDPLKRTPRRERPLESYSAADFSLEELSFDELDLTVSSERSHEEILERLRTYLAETDDPDVQTILSLLTDNTNRADNAPITEPASPTAEISEEPLFDPALFVPDDSDDIFEDLKRLNLAATDIETSELSILHLVDEAADEPDELDNSFLAAQQAFVDQSMLTLSDAPASDSESVTVSATTADDLLLLTGQEPEDDRDPILDSDGILTVPPEES